MSNVTAMEKPGLRYELNGKEPLVHLHMVGEWVAFFTFAHEHLEVYSSFPK